MTMSITTMVKCCELIKLVSAFNDVPAGDPERRKILKEIAKTQTPLKMEGFKMNEKNNRMIPYLLWPWDKKKQPHVGFSISGHGNLVIKRRHGWFMTCTVSNRSLSVKTSGKYVYIAVILDRDALQGQ